MFKNVVETKLNELYSTIYLEVKLQDVKESQLITIHWSSSHACFQSPLHVAVLRWCLSHSEQLQEAPYTGYDNYNDDLSSFKR